MRAPRRRTSRPSLSLKALLTLSACLTACDDLEESPFPSSYQESLPPDRGFSFHAPSFEVPAGKETHDCYFVSVPDIRSGDDIWVDRTVIETVTGGHHVDVFRVRTIVKLDPNDGEPFFAEGTNGRVIKNGECKNIGNYSDWPVASNTQNAPTGLYDAVWQLPIHVALRFSPGERLMIQVHYLNTTETPIYGYASVNFYATAETNPIELGTLMGTVPKIRVCQSGPATQVVSGHCTVPGARITAANGHFHARGKRFAMYPWDGKSSAPSAEKFYESLSFREPFMASNLEVPIPADGGLWWTCDYTWAPPSTGCAAVNAADPMHQGDCCYVTGPDAETNEHCIAFLYYWPKGDGAKCE